MHIAPARRGVLQIILRRHIMEIFLLLQFAFYFPKWNFNGEKNVCPKRSYLFIFLYFFLYGTQV